MTDLTIRHATRQDLPALAMLYEASGLDPAGSSDLAVLGACWERQCSETPTARVLIAERDGAPLGTLTCFVLPLLLHGGAPAALVEAVAVHPDAQGQGVGRALMDEAMAIAQRFCCYKLALSSNAKRDGAHRFYDTLGYERHGISFVVTPQRSTGHDDER